MRPQPLRCSEVLERLPLFVGEDLEGDLSRAVLAHLAGCASCREEEARARDARQRFRAVLDGSLAGLARPGLWPEIRQGLVAEGRLVEAPAPREARVAGAGASASAPARRTALDGPVATAGDRPRRPAAAGGRLVRVLAPLAAAAAVAGLLFFGQGDPLGSGSSEPAAGGARIAERQPDAASAPVVLASQEQGGLRRVAPGELALYQGAEPLRSAGAPLSTNTTGALSDTTLVHYR